MTVVLIGTSQAAALASSKLTSQPYLIVTLSSTGTPVPIYQSGEPVLQSLTLSSYLNVSVVNKLKYIIGVLLVQLVNSGLISAMPLSETADTTYTNQLISYITTQSVNIGLYAGIDFYVCGLLILRSVLIYTGNIWKSALNTGCFHSIRIAEQLAASIGWQLVL